MTGPHTFAWMPLDPVIITRLPSFAQPSDSDPWVARVDVSLRLLPEIDDWRLSASRFVIAVFDGISAYRIYDGHYRPDLLLASVPMRFTDVYVTFWAFDEAAGCYLQWASLAASPLFSGRPMRVELYREHHPDVDAWYRISPQ